MFQQATVGDNTAAQPWAIQIEARAKWDAWTAEKGKSKQQAMAEYMMEIARQDAVLKAYAAASATGGGCTNCQCGK